MINVATPSESNIREKEHEELEENVGNEYSNGASGERSTQGCDPQTGVWLKQIPETPSDISIQRCATIGTSKIRTTELEREHKYCPQG